MKKTSGILKELKSVLLSAIGENLSDLVLFGSRASGKSNRHSDYDVLIVLRNDSDWEYRKLVKRICYEVALKNLIVIDTKVITEKEMKSSLKGKQPIYIDAIREGLHA